MDQQLDANQWVDRYGDLMFRYTLVRVKDTDAAEEIVQTALIAALQARKSYEGRSSEKSWLFGILKHKILDHFRDIKQKRSYEAQSDDDQDPYEKDYKIDGHWVTPPKDWHTDPERAATNRQLREALAACMEGLPEKFRSIFVLKEIEGLNSDDICKEFDITSTNLWVILHRARNLLRKCLESRNVVND